MPQLISNLADLHIHSTTRILGIFPHPDDETAFAGGFLHDAAALGAIVDVFCVTKGEKSTLRYGLKDSDDLASIRINEMKKVSAILGISNLTIGDYPDGELESTCKTLRPALETRIQAVKPHIVITLEPDGIYGHPDHICLSNLIHDFHFFSDLKFRLFYATMPPSYQRSEDIKHMAKKAVIQPILPTHVLTLSKKTGTAKRAAAKAHYSQLGENESFWQQWEAHHLFQKEYLHIVSS